MESQNWLTEFTNRQIFEMIVVVLVFLLVFFEAIWLLIKYMWEYKD